MKVLILGGLGFIGFHLAQKIQGIDVSIDIVDYRNLKTQNLSDQCFFENPCHRYFQDDLSDLGSNFKLDTDYDYIFHLAALLGVENVTQNPYEVMKQNTLITIKALEIGKAQKKLKKLIFTSTSEVYAGTLHHYSLDFPTPEETPLTLTPLENGRTSYMLSKIYGEALCQHAGLPFIILRPHNIYGPRMGNRHVIPQLLKKAFYLDSNGALEVYSPTHKRTFCYIDDAVNYIIKLMMCPQKNITLNLGVESPEISMKDLGEQIVQTTAKRIPVKSMPDTQGSPLRRVPKTKDLIAITNYQPQISLNEGLQRTYDWYRDNQFNRGDQK
jgi:UDP-glucose 4-epimerase